MACNNFKVYERMSSSGSSEDPSSPIEPEPRMAMLPGNGPIIELSASEDEPLQVTSEFASAIKASLEADEDIHYIELDNIPNSTEEEEADLTENLHSTADNYPIELSDSEAGGEDKEGRMASNPQPNLFTSISGLASSSEVSQRPEVSSDAISSPCQVLPPPKSTETETNKGLKQRLRSAASSVTLRTSEAGPCPSPTPTVLPTTSRVSRGLGAIPVASRLLKAPKTIAVTPKSSSESSSEDSRTSEETPIAWKGRAEVTTRASKEAPSASKGSSAGAVPLRGPRSTPKASSAVTGTSRASKGSSVGSVAKRASKMAPSPSKGSSATRAKKGKAAQEVGSRREKKRKVTFDQEIAAKSEDLRSDSGSSEGSIISTGSSN